MSAGSYGFEVPEGDPGTLRSAATAWRQLGIALDGQGQAVAAGSEVALGAGGWSGSAAGAFTGSAERLIGSLRTGVDACGTAASALTELATALEHVQQVTRQALVDCGQAQTDLDTQQQTATQAGQDADTATTSAATAADPVTASTYQRQADDARRTQGLAQAAAGQSETALTTAQTKGQQAVTAYDHTAQSVTQRLHSAAGELRPLTDLDDNWADPVVSAGGHVNDFLGAGAVGVAKGYDSTLAVAAGKLTDETETVLGNPSDIQRIEQGLPLSYDDEPDPLFNALENQADAANSPVTKVLSKGLDEDTYGVLGKVPYLAAGFTAADMLLNRNNGPGKAIVEPLGNLAVSTGIAEGTSTVVSGGIATLAAGDGTVALLAGSAAVPVVGEVVIVGAVTVGGTYLIDKGVTWVWNNGGAHVAGEAWDGVKDAVTHPVATAKHVVHDLEPWHWSL